MTVDNRWTESYDLPACDDAGGAEMQVEFTRDFARDVRNLPQHLQSKAWALIEELQSGPTPASLKPGWHFHGLESSRYAAIYLDMNYRILLQRKANVVTLCRALKHDPVYRAPTLQSDFAEVVGRTTEAELGLHDLYGSMVAFGISEDDASAFRGISNDDDLMDALAAAPPAVGQLALSLYEVSGLVLPKNGVRMLQSDEALKNLIESGGERWQLYLHPTQEYIVGLPFDHRVAVAGSAGTGKTVCAWHRAQQFIQAERSFGFVCPDEGALSVSKSALEGLAAGRQRAGYYLVPRGPDDLLQLAETVDHILMDECQEIPVTWLNAIATQSPWNVGFTLFYDLNQLGGHIQSGDVSRYRRRISDWKTMLNRFPGMHQMKLTINYRNSREVARHYLDLLTDALPTPPLAEIPAFESGEVFVYKVASSEMTGAIAGLLRQLLRDHDPREIGVATVTPLANRLALELRSLQMGVSDDIAGELLSVTHAEAYRGHERKTMVVVVEAERPVTRKFGTAIEAYIAMSRAIQRLVVIELT